MPNFWTKTTQSVYEFLYGPRTRDIEFDAKVEEVNITLTHISEISKIATSFGPRTLGLWQFCQDMHSKIHLAYAPNVIYSQFIKDVCEAHKNIENAYLKCKESIGMLSQMSNEWNKLHNEVKENLIKREEARQVYDHYDVKMEKVVRERNDKMARHINETPKDIEEFDRNDGKYKRAANDLIQLSNYSYKIIQELLDYRYRMLNPLIAGMVAEEKKFFDACADFFRKFDGITQKVVALDRGFQSTPIVYDPTKHIRAYRLLVGVNVNDLPTITPKEKKEFSYNDYKNQAGLNTTTQGGNQSGGYGNQSQMQSSNQHDNQADLYSKVMGQSQINPTNTFSYDAYKAKIQGVPEKKFDNQSCMQINKQSAYQQPTSSNQNPFSQSTIQGNIGSGMNINEDKGYSQTKVNVSNPYAGIDFNMPSNPGSMINNPLNYINNQSNNNPYAQPNNNPYAQPSNTYTNKSYNLPANNDYMKYSNIQGGGNNNNSQFPKNSDFPH